MLYSSRRVEERGSLRLSAPHSDFHSYVITQASGRVYQTRYLLSCAFFEVEGGARNLWKELNERVKNTCIRFTSILVQGTMGCADSALRGTTQGACRIIGPCGTSSCVGDHPI